VNERIRELAEESHNEFYNVHIDLELFAELIVKECCDIFVELRTRPADLAALDVKKHFGVK
jgi:hypothetical protein